MQPEIDLICGAVFASCICGLEPHDDTVAHKCGRASGDQKGCGGSWIGHERGPRFQVISYPQVPGGSRGR